LAFAVAAARALNVAIIAAPLALISHGSWADEGGSSFWTPGSFASLAATPSQPGFSLTSVYYHPSVSAGAEVVRAERIRIGRRSGLLVSDASANSDASKDLAMVTPAYTFATPVLGGQANINLTAVYGRNSTSQNERLSDALLVGPSVFTRSLFETISDSVIGFGDLAPQASLRWNAGVHNVMTYATGNIPVGAYNPARLSNIGIGHSALDGGVGYTYLDQAGREFSAVAGLTTISSIPTRSIKTASTFIWIGRRRRPCPSSCRSAWLVTSMIRSPAIADPETGSDVSSPAWRA
jgi:hypothetical protein